jgi:chemotaxis protein CheD
VSEIVVRVADLRAEAGTAVLVTLGLGSCVACVLHDAAAGVGGIAHVLLPSRTLARDRSNPAKFAETAIPLLVERAVALGAVRERLRARLVGGASMFANVAVPGVAQMGERNVQAVKDALKAARVPVTAADTGGDYGRSVYLFLPGGRVEVRSVLRGIREL